MGGPGRPRGGVTPCPGLWDVAPGPGPGPQPAGGLEFGGARARQGVQGPSNSCHLSRSLSVCLQSRARSESLSLCSATCTGGKGTNTPGGCSIQAGPGPAPCPPAATAGLFLGFSLTRMVGTCACLSGIVGVSLSPAELCARRCPHGPHQDSQGTADLPLGSWRETLESGAGDY